MDTEIHQIIIWGISSFVLAGMVTWSVYLFAKNLREKKRIKAELIKSQQIKMAGLKEAQVALRESEEKYRVVFEQAQDGFLLIAGDGKILDFNNATHNDLGYTREEFERLTIADIDLDENADDVRARMKQIMSMGSIIFEARHLSKSGEIRDVRISGRAVELAGKKVFSSVWRDITEQKQSENALRENERKLAAQNIQLEERTITLNEILEQVEAEKQKIGEQVIANVETLLLPILQKMKDRGTEIDKVYIDLLEESLIKLTSSFGATLERQIKKLSPREIEICNLIRNGSTSKEIGQILSLSKRTIDGHRENIREKLGLKTGSMSLSAYLKSL